MWLEAILTRDDLLRLAGQFSPMRLRLGEGGELTLSEPTELSFIAGSGVELVCAGKLHWAVLGIDVPVTLSSLRVHLGPTVEERPEGPTLVFKLELRYIDVALLPALLDSRLSERINEELAKRHTELAWAFGSTLSHVFGLPAALESASALRLEVAAGTVKVTGEALGFAVSFRTEVEHGARAEHPAPPADEAASANAPAAADGGAASEGVDAADGVNGEPSSAEASDRAFAARARVGTGRGTPLVTVVARGALAAAAMAATFVLGRISAPRRRWLAP